MKLLKFRITNFRSIKDSTWIDCDDVTNIIGVNEAGKSNALLALWKLWPAGDGDIDLLQDMPRGEYVTMKDNAGDITFIETIFSMEDENILLNKLCELTGRDKSELSTLNLSRLYSGEYYYKFPNERHITSLKSVVLCEFIENIKQEISNNEVTGSNDSDYKVLAEKKIDDTLKMLKVLDEVDIVVLGEINKKIAMSEIDVAEDSYIKHSYNKFTEYIAECINKINKPSIKCEKVWAEIQKSIPKFVYYSNYGNLDSEIYLPHVIENLKRKDITGIAAAKARTLKILFDFIRLNPEEILELGNESNNNLTDEEIKSLAKKKAERTVLLNSASTKLTREFKNWWKQGSYIFDLRADGKLFKIWVSDKERPDKVALESRSTGLQWFLSFFLTFLVETTDKLQNTILLLDEAGLSLHPLAQKDLINFFKSLAEHNQIIHTTHSPFLVDTDNIDKVKIAYVDSDGYTVLSNNSNFAGR